MFDGTVGVYFRYASTVFAHRLQTYAKVHREIAICCGRLYKTVSYLPSTVISGRLSFAPITVAFAWRRAASKGFLLYGDLEILHPLGTSPTSAVITLPYDDAMVTRKKWYAKCPRRW